jgi:hypothetical protein
VSALERDAIARWTWGDAGSATNYGRWEDTGKLSCMLGFVAFKTTAFPANFAFTSLSCSPH